MIICLIGFKDFLLLMKSRHNCDHLWPTLAATFLGDTLIRDSRVGIRDWLRRPISTTFKNKFLLLKI